MKVFLFLLLAMALVLSAADVNVSGKWSGSFNVTRPDGTNDGGTAYAVLKQDGAHLTGTAGPDEDNQWTLENGTVSGNKVTFQVKKADEGTVFKCDLTLEGEHLKGPITAFVPDGETLAGTLDLTRAK
ncbi:MAG: hypothetical protein WB579_18465 [Bryobacteraceae bacterium]